MRDPRTGKPGQSGFVTFNSIENATLAMEAVDGTKAPNGENLTVAYAHGLRSKLENDKLHYFVYAPSEESEIRSIFQKFNDSIVEVNQCMLFILSNFVRKTHME